MKKVLIIAILALNVVSHSYLALSQSNQSFTIKSAIAEEYGNGLVGNSYTCVLGYDDEGETVHGTMISCMSQENSLCEEMPCTASDESW